MMKYSAPFVDYSFITADVSKNSLRKVTFNIAFFKIIDEIFKIANLKQATSRI